MHGVIRLITELEGETVVKVETEIGYLHRAFEKSCENSSWTQAIPYTDRLPVSSIVSSDIARCEKLWGIDYRALQVHPRNHERNIGITDHRPASPPRRGTGR
jgi:NADH:ubiquinone oxidoreductase subunit D